MNKPTNNQFLQLKVGADKPVLPVGKAGERILELTLLAPPAAADRLHVPLNLALVLDRSGSMHGEKLHYVKEAALHVIDLLSEQDRAAVVIYDDKVETLMPSQFLTRAVKQDLKKRIQRLQTGGSTFLYGGWLAGSRQVAEVAGEKSFNRTLLLTDGLANVGVRDIGTLSMHAQELFVRNISTSCFGVGADYDENLLEAMSTLGGGSFHFLETVQAIPLVFEREFDELINITARDIQVKFQLPAGTQVSVPAGWHTDVEDGNYTIFLGSMAAEGEKTLYVKLSNLALVGADTLTVPVQVSGMDAAGEKHSVTAEVVFKGVPEAEEAEHKGDEELLARYAEVDLADKARQALQRERAGDRVGASQMMNQSISKYASSVSDAARQRYQHLSTEMMQGMDAMQRKSRHYQMYRTSQVKGFTSDYRLRFVSGVPIVEVEGRMVALDSGATHSFGREAAWNFLGEVYNLPQEANGRSLNTLSAALGTQVDVVLGMDILRELFVQLDPKRRLVTFSRQPLRCRGWRLDLELEEGTITCKMPFAGSERRMQVHTAFPRSLVPVEWAGEGEPVDTEMVRPLGMPEFETALYRLDAKLGHKTLRLTCGVLNADIQSALGLQDGQGLIGADVLAMLPTTLAFPEKRWVLLV